MKVVINACHGGFGLSEKACEILIKKYGWKTTPLNDQGFKVDQEAPFWIDNTKPRPSWQDKYNLSVAYSKDIRSNPDLIAVVEDLGKKANGQYAELKIVEIPDNVDWEIEEYDGWESVHEKHRSWS